METHRRKFSRAIVRRSPRRSCLLLVLIFPRLQRPSRRRCSGAWMDWAWRLRRRCCRTLSCRRWRRRRAHQLPHARPPADLICMTSRKMRSIFTPRLLPRPLRLLLTRPPRSLLLPPPLPPLPLQPHMHPAPRSAVATMLLSSPRTTKWSCFPARTKMRLQRGASGGRCNGRPAPRVSARLLSRPLLLHGPYPRIAARFARHALRLQSWRRTWRPALWPPLPTKLTPPLDAWPLSSMPPTKRP